MLFMGTRPTWTGGIDLAYTAISESEAPGYFIGTLEAIDADGDPLTYDIDDLTTEVDESNRERDCYDYLSVESDTGNVTLAVELDYEEFDKLICRWLVSDPSNSDVQSQIISMFVVKWNDNSPVFVGGVGPYAQDVNEDEGIGTIIFSVNATDADHPGDTITYTLKSDTGCETEAFIIDRQGNIIVDEELDYTTNVQYVLCIQATLSILIFHRSQDGGIPEGTAEVQLVISIKDVQNLPPVFYGQPYDEQIYEDAAIGDLVLTVEALDGDRGVSPLNTINYTLIESGNGTFEIDSANGEIKVAKKLDRDEDPNAAIYTLTVEARENDDSQPSNQTTSTANVYIRLLDVDDNVPTFVPATGVSTSIQEHSPIGSQLDLMGLQVFDLDSGDAGSIELELEGDGGMFYLVSDTVSSQGVVDIRVQNSTGLDYEKRKVFEFEVKASSSLNASVATYVSVTVNLTNINDNTPVFTQQQYDVLLPENSVPGTFVVQIKASDADEDDELEYDLYGYNSEWFSINRTSGEITVSESGEFDAERLSVYFLTCQVKDDERVATSLLNVTLVDENDEEPVFQGEPYEVSISEYNIEDVTLQEPVLQLEASDGDITEQVLTYSILSGNEAGKFVIDPINGTISRRQSIDRENMENMEDGVYSLLVMVEDNGDPSLNDTATVEITIQDVNDNAPSFQSAVYEAYVDENSPSRVYLCGARYTEYVANVTATDQDVDSSGAVYRIEGASLFVIDSYGIITVSGSLDREAEDFYNLTVTATDRDDPFQEATCHVLITVRDVNDEAPVFVESSASIEVYEDTTSCDSGACMVLAWLNATDPDEDSSLVYSITSVDAFDENDKEVSDGDFSSQFRVINTTGEIFLQEPLDRETVQRFDIFLQVEDTNAETSDSQSDEAELTVTVLDVNDNVPQFIDLPDSFSVAETDQVGMVISVDIRAEDPDDGDNGIVRYELPNNASGLVEIEETTGILKVAQPIDREVYSSLTITIRARDEGNPPQIKDTVRVIYIEDVNDNSPVFNESIPTIVNVYEDTDVDSTVLVVQAIDIDPVYGNVTYDISTGNAEGTFHIGIQSGDITIVEELDRETQSQYVLTVVASDGQRQSNEEVTINVLDVNDNAPVFSTSFPTTVSISEVADQGSSVTVIAAVDDDESGTNNSEVRYFMENLGDRAYFEIDSETGQVTVSSSSLEPGSYICNVTAYDLGDPQMFSTPRNFTVVVTDYNDDRPVFINPTQAQKFYLEEDYTGIVTTAQATLPNSEPFYAFDTSLGVTDDYKHFEIGRISGKINIITSTDRETQEQYILTVKAINNATGVASTSDVTFSVIVIDKDDNEPAYWGPGTGSDEVLEPPNEEMMVFEHEPEGTFVGIVPAAVDLDSDTYNTIYYYLVSGNEQGYFELDSSSGNLTLAKEIDREQTDQFILVVRADNNSNFEPSVGDVVDPDMNQQLAWVTVFVLDINDSRPRFLSYNYAAGLLYTTNPGESIITVKAVDPDEGENAVVEYEIVYQASFDEDDVLLSDEIETFAISSEAGNVIVQLKPALSSEDHYYIIKAMAKDSKDPELNDNTTFSVYLLREIDQVSVLFKDEVNNVLAIQEDFARLTEEIMRAAGNLYTNVSAVVDSVDIQRNADGAEIANSTVMLMHVVNVDDNSIIPPVEIQAAFDGALQFADELEEYHVVSVDYSTAAVITDPLETLQKVSFSLAGIMIILFVILAYAFYVSTSSYRRKLRAATADLRDVNDNTATSPAPGTNKFSEQQNPIFDNPTYNTPMDSDLPPKQDEIASEAGEDNGGYEEIQEATIEFQEENIPSGLVQPETDKNNLLSQLIAGFEETHGAPIDTAMPDTDLYVSDV
ncbi:cadherin-23-like [Diadema antillarum]|uniref:cadherin-23-like n=1 Tax=Diadema antillarum TaxID=105358 RepID=UPI003A83B137